MAVSCKSAANHSWHSKPREGDRGFLPTYDIFLRVSQKINTRIKGLTNRCTLHSQTKFLSILSSELRVVYTERPHQAFHFMEVWKILTRDLLKVCFPSSLFR